jgi:RNA polymerase sigma-70 factor (ECF subfamily)
VTKYKRVYRAVFGMSRAHLEAPERASPQDQRIQTRLSRRRASVQDDPRSAIMALLPRLRRFGVSLTGSVAAADALVQAACERALSRMTQLHNPARLDAWIYAIMRNLWVEEMRTGRVEEHEDVEAAHDVNAQGHETGAEGLGTAAAVRRALQELSAEQRSVLILVCVDGMSYKKTAEILGISIGTVVGLLSGARAALAERISEETPSQTGAVIAMASKFVRRGSER